MNFTTPGRRWPTKYPFQRIIDGSTGQTLERDGFILAPKPGDYQFLDEFGKATEIPRAVVAMRFYCLKNSSDYCGQIRIRREGFPSDTPSWAWDGNLDAPTLTPSINCLDCWHGWLKNGNFEEC